MHTVMLYLASLPVELFTLVASFLEELISPIPSFFAYVPAGAALQIQGGALWYLLVLATIGSCGHLVASIIVYAFANRFRDFLFKKRAAWFGVRKKDIAIFRKKISGKGSSWALFGMWALPIFPGAPLSILCGFVRFPFKSFVMATFFGSIINGLAYLVVGYLGLQTFAALKFLEFTGQIVTLLAVIGLVAWFMHHRHGAHERRTTKRRAA